MRAIFRRQVLAATPAALAAVAALPSLSALATPVDPIAALAAERWEVEALANSLVEVDEPACDVAMARLNAIDEEMLALPVSTKAGAIAALEVALVEFETFFANGEDPDNGTLLIRQAMKGARKVLQS